MIFLLFLAAFFLDFYRYLFVLHLIGAIVRAIDVSLTATSRV